MVIVLTFILPNVERVEIFFIPIIYFIHFWAYINCLMFEIIWISRIENMGMCAIAHNGNTRDKSGRFYKVITIIMHCVVALFIQNS